jgi:hypothetical protein
MNTSSAFNTLSVFQDDKILIGGDRVVAVNTKEEAHALIRSLLKENMDCATLGIIGGLAYWSDYYYYVRLEDRYFLISRGY